jgi:hypothetical protein
MNGLITSELQKNTKSSLKVQRTLYNICSQDGVNVLFHVLPFESFPHGITEFRYYLWWLRTLPANELISIPVGRSRKATDPRLVRKRLM